MLADAGYRVIVPHLRGYGTTPSGRPTSLRNGQQSVFALDAIALMDALGDRGAPSSPGSIGARARRTSSPPLWPERFRGHVSVSGYLIGSREANAQSAPAARRARLVVPVLLRHRARPRGLRAVPERVRPADLADRVAALGVRRRDVRSQRGILRQPGPRRHRHPQLPMAARPCGRRAGVRRSGAKAGRAPADHRSHHHPGGRRQWGSTSGCRGVSLALRRRLRAPGRHRRRRAQPAAGSAAGVRRAVMDVDRS